MDYTLFVQIDSAPQGARLRSASDTNGTILGETPCVIPVNMSWRKSLFGPRWRRLNLDSPGGVCHATRAKNGAWVLSFELAASKPGYIPQSFNIHVASLPPPGFFWSGRDDWPIKSSLLLNLDRDTNAAASRALSAPAPAPTVAIARSSAKKDLMRLFLTSNTPGAEVYLDNARVGVAPINLVLQSGSYQLEVRKPGFEPYMKTIEAAGETDAHLEAILTPSNPSKE